MGEAVIVAGIGSRKGVATADVVAAIEHALEKHGLAITALSALATTAHKREEKAIFEAGEELGLPVMVVEAKHLSSPPGTGGEVSSPELARWRDGEGGVDNRPPLRFASLTTSPPVPGGEEKPHFTTLTTSALSIAVAGTPSVSEAAALAAAGQGARLLGPRTVLGPVTCAIAVSENRP